MKSNIVELKNISFSYSNKIEVLKNINLVIKEGSFVSLIGHNGSGKSTLAKILAGLYKPSNGEYLFKNKNVKELEFDEFRNKVSVVFQNPDNQFIASTVEEDIAFGLENKLTPKDKMHEIVFEYASKVGMNEFLNKEPTELSGGQKQRVAIAGVLCLSPELVIFDEATSMLDPRGKKEIRNLINDLRKENKNMSFVSITHDINEAFNSDYIYVLDKGEVALEGTKDELVSNYKKLYEIGLSLPMFDEILIKLNNAGIDVKDISNIVELGEKLCR